MADERIAFSVTEAARALGISERTIRLLLARGDLRCRRLGRRVLVPVDALRELVGADGCGRSMAEASPMQPAEAA